MQNLKINATSPYFTGILAILLGLLMAIWPGQVVHYMVAILGWFFVIIGAVPVIMSLVRKSPVAIFSVIVLIIGIIILCFADKFREIFIWVFGILLILGAIQQFNIMTIAKKGGAHVEFYNMIFPAILLLAGVLVLINPFAVEKAIIIFFGISIIFYGVTIIINQYRFKRMLDSVKKQESTFDITDKQ